MNKKIEFFDNEMDEKTVESISDDFPILTDEEKDRIFSRIEKEVDNKKSSITYEVYNDEVKGVERCIRPRWIELFGTAAMIAVVIGGLGFGKYCMNNMNKTAPKDNEQEVTTEVDTTVPDDHVTTESSKPKVTTTNKKSSDKSVTTSFVEVVAPVYENDNDNKVQGDADPKVLSMHELVNNYTDGTNMIDSMVKDKTTTTTVTTTFVERKTNTTVTEAVVNTQNPAANVDNSGVLSVDKAKEMASIAESLIKNYDIITLIKVAQLPADESCEIKSFIHGPGMYSSRAYINEYKKVDGSMFESMDEMKDFYHSVIIEPDTSDSLFGPELTTEQIENDFYFDSYEPDYFYISIDGELYERVIGKKDISERTELPVELYDVKEDSFKADKVYNKYNGLEISTTTFSFIKDVETGNWRISDVSYTGMID